MSDHLRVPGDVASIRIVGAAENNLRDVTVALPHGLTAVIGVSGSVKSSLYHEARRRHFEALSLGSPWLRSRPARVREIAGLGPAVGGWCAAAALPARTDARLRSGSRGSALKLACRPPSDRSPAEAGQQTSF
jgi:hypothetical protein